MCLTRVRVGGPVDQPHRNVGLPHRPDPPIAMRVAVVDEPADLVQSPACRRCTRGSRGTGRASGATVWCRDPNNSLMVGSIMRRDNALPCKRTQEVPQRRSRQHLLQQPRGVGLVEQAAVEPGDRLDAQRPVRPAGRTRGAPTTPGRPSRRCRGRGCAQTRDRDRTAAPRACRRGHAPCTRTSRACRRTPCRACRVRPR